MAASFCGWPVIRRTRRGLPGGGCHKPEGGARIHRGRSPSTGRRRRWLPSSACRRRRNARSVDDGIAGNAAGFRRHTLLCAPTRPGRASRPSSRCWLQAPAATAGAGSGWPVAGILDSPLPRCRQGTGIGPLAVHLGRTRQRQSQTTWLALPPGCPISSHGLASPPDRGVDHRASGDGPAEKRESRRTEHHNMPGGSLCSRQESRGRRPRGPGRTPDADEFRGPAGRYAPLDGQPRTAGG